MANGKHYRSGKTPARQPHRTMDDALYSYRPEAHPQRTAPRNTPPAESRTRTAYAAPQAPARPVKQPVRKKKKNVVIPIVAVLLILAALGILAYMLWDLGAVSMLLGMLS